MQSPRDSEVGKMGPGVKTGVDRVDLDAGYLAVLHCASPGRFSKIHVTILVPKDHVIVVRMKWANLENRKSGNLPKVKDRRRSPAIHVRTSR